MAIDVEQPLSEEDRTLWTDRLKEARAAYHKLAIGDGVASFTDQNGERVQYTKADMRTLANYISDIVALLGTPPTPFTSNAPRPLRFLFGG